MQNFVLGIDIGGTNLRLGLVDKNGNQTGFEKINTLGVLKNKDNIIEELASVIKEYSKRHLGDNKIIAISIGFPSTINRDRTIVVQTPNIPAIKDELEVVKELSKALDVKVYINRDVNMLLLFDLWDLNLDKKECVCGIYFGTGIGYSIFKDGRMIVGKNGVAAELGHLPVYGNELKCNCGNIGCIETLVSGIALERIRQTYFKETKIEDLFTLHKNEKHLIDFVKGIAGVVAGQLNIFDPDAMVLGGGILQMKDFPKNLLEDTISEYCRKPYPEKNMNLCWAKESQENGSIGAGLYGWLRYEDASYI